MTSVLMRNDERNLAIQSFGYTEREAAFLCLAALHGGYFLRRQYNAFLGCQRGGNADRLIEKGVLQGHVRVHESANRTQIYHVGAKPFFAAIGEEDNRNRRWHQPYPVKTKLMGLDFVLAHRQHHYLATEAEKLDYFAGTLGLNRSYLPQRIYRSRYGRNITTRYFVDKFPLFLSGASSAPSPVVGFCYVDGSTGKPSGFDTYLLQYKDLFGRLDGFGIIYMAGDERMFPKAERIFGRVCGNGAQTIPVPRDRDIVRLREHFRARDLFERRETSSFGKAGLDRLREELTEFGGPEYEALYGQWRERGDCFFGGGAESPEKRSGGFATYRVDHEYELLGELSRKIPA
jgi:hypothetical protein